VIDVSRHAAEKFHAMTRVFGDRENSRVRDLVDIVILDEHEMLSSDALTVAIERVWHEREGASPPARLPSPPASWRPRFEAQATAHGLRTTSFDDALGRIARLWPRP